MPDHTKQELAIFRSFVAAGGIQVVPGSIEKREPPEPDIHCQLRTGEGLAFELVEVVDRHLAETVSLQTRLQRVFETEAAGRKSFSSLFSNALIAVGFEPSLSMRQRRNVVPLILDHLETHAAGMIGAMQIPVGKLSGKVVRLEVSRGDFVGPSFHVDSVASFGDVTFDTIAKKLGRTYETDWRLELLAYFRVQPMNVGTSWTPQLEARIGRSLGKSAFHRVWLFEEAPERVVGITRNASNVSS